MPIQWKGNTYNIIHAGVQLNTKNTSSNSLNATHLAMKSQPIINYRKEIPINNTCTYHANDSTIRDIMDGAGQTIVNGYSTITQDNVILYNTKQTYDNINSACNVCVPNTQLANRCMSQQNNALRRLRSAGMIKNNTLQTKYYTSNNEYQYGRNKSIEQNEFNMLRAGNSTTIPGTPASFANMYGSNTISLCPGNGGPTNTTKYYPVIYKPNNSKFANQGSVSSATRLLRLKYDTVNKGGQKTNTQYGILTANAITYSISDATTEKRKLGTGPNLIPTYNKYTGNMDTCLDTHI